MSDERLRFGVCWQAEHWPSERWAVDTRLMVDAGLDCVRCFDRAWQLIEPEPERYDWRFTDGVLDCCAAAGLDVIAAIPSAQPPSWLAEKHPEAIAQRLDGRAWDSDGRRCYDYGHDGYRDRCRRLVRAMAERYAGDRRILAWQLDDELWCRHDELAGPAALARFRAWCEERYRGIDGLNEAWGLRFQASELLHFGQVELPLPGPERNPHQMLDYRRFLAELGAEFVFEQRDLISHTQPAMIASVSATQPMITAFTPGASVGNCLAQSTVGPNCSRAWMSMVTATTRGRCRPISVRTSRCATGCIVHTRAGSGWSNSSRRKSAV